LQVWLNVSSRADAAAAMQSTAASMIRNTLRFIQSSSEIPFCGMRRSSYFPIESSGLSTTL
jgi:hypothetical protein